VSALESVIAVAAAIQRELVRYPDEQIEAAAGVCQRALAAEDPLSVLVTEGGQDLVCCLGGPAAARKICPELVRRVESERLAALEEQRRNPPPPATPEPDGDSWSPNPYGGEDRHKFY